ncbi:MAG: type III pantothenate kinase [Acidobacteriota bacterium]
MLVVIDVGNSNTVLGIYRGQELLESFRISTSSGRTADEVLSLVVPLLQRSRLNPLRTSAVMVSSVVPPLNGAIVSLSQRLFGVAPSFVDAFTDTGVPVRYDNPAEVGADRIVNSVAARHLYGAPVVVVDLGTATTFDIVDGSGSYAGGLIAPGIGIAAEALFSRASRLYRIDIRQPDELIARNTGGAMQAGIYYGYLGLVDGILKRLKAEIEGLETVIATGGLAELIAGGSEHISGVDQLITLNGLRLIYERRQGS